MREDIGLQQTRATPGQQLTLPNPFLQIVLQIWNPESHPMHKPKNAKRYMSRKVATPKKGEMTLCCKSVCKSESLDLTECRWFIRCDSLNLNLWR